ncbi:MAG: amino acid ABC transporter, partial [Pseudomonas capeferrum]
MNKTMAMVGACALLLTGAANAETLRFATEGAYPPFNYVDADNQLHGFD